MADKSSRLQLLLEAVDKNFTKNLRKGDESLDRLNKTAKKSKDPLKSMEEGLQFVAKSLGAVVAAGFAVKKIFDFGREGAVVEQTADSFEFLMQKVEAAPDTMDRLTEAGKGTLTVMDLMSSTSTLLAGATGEVAQELANATPQLLEIAKAANKLNPALGTTEFMYRSIATGVKRAQPLILDNLGLTLKVGEANIKEAAARGKTVEQLTAQERTIAILNATLEAGDALIAQVGGSTDSATDSFDRLDVTMTELKQTIQKKLAPFLTKAADAIVLIITAGKKLRAFLDEHEKDMRDVAGSYEEYRTEMERVADETHRWTITQFDFNQAMEEGGISAHLAQRALVIYSEAQFNAARDTEDTTGASDELLAAIEALRGGVGETAEEVDKFAEILIDTESAADKAKVANKKFLDEIDRDLASPIDDFVKDIKWFLATGGQFEAAWGRIQDLARTAPEEALGLAQELLVMIEDSRVELDMTTGEKAAENIAGTLGVELWEAREMIAGTDGLQESMAGLGDIYIDLGELERMEAMTLRILTNLNLMRTAGIGVGAPGMPWDPGGTSTPSGGVASEGLPDRPGGGSQEFSGAQQGITIIQHNEIQGEQDVHEMAFTTAEIINRMRR